MRAGSPDKSEIDGFKIDKTVEWETDDQARFKDWQFVNKVCGRPRARARKAPHVTAR
jgi:hypothetical protein